MKTKAIIGICCFAVAALFVFGCERKVTVNEQNDVLASCFTCHGDQEFELIQARGQWEHSKHASGDNIDRNRSNRSIYASCEKCHTHEGFVAWATNTTYDGTMFSAIGCFTCHAPHTNGNLNLRVTTAVALKNNASYDKDGSNICAVCHQARENVNTYVADSVRLTTRWGPHHSVHADMLLGTNAYEYDGYTYRRSAHTNTTAEGCLDCHMTGSIGYYVGGHTFRMAHDESQYINVAGCNVSTCHNNAITTTFNIPASEDFDWDGEIEGVMDEVEGLLDSLRTLLLAANLITSQNLPVNNRLVATADSAGAVYNFLFVEEDRSLGIHNTKYAVDLLRSSINYLTSGSPGGPGRRQPELAGQVLAAAH